MSGLVDSTPNQNNSGEPVFESMSASPMANSVSSNRSAASAIPENSLNSENSENSENSAIPENSLNSENSAIPEGSEISSESLNNSMPVENLPPMDNRNLELKPQTTTMSPVPQSFNPPVEAPKSSEGRSDKQRSADMRAKEFRARVNPIYLEKFANIPPTLRPKGFPATAARQAIEMSPEEQNKFVNNVADERRNAIEIKLGRKTRRVNPSTLKDIETILKMAERSLISKNPSQKVLVREFGRETRKIARGYTSEDIATLNNSYRTTPTRNVLLRPKSLRGKTLRANNSGRMFKNKNNVVSSLEESKENY